MAFDALYLSICLNKATFKDAKIAKKAVNRAKEEQYCIKFGHLGDLKNLHLQVFADASLGNIEHQAETKSVMGAFIALANEDLRISPLSWKSKCIDKVAEDIKSAETLAMENAIDDSVYLSSMISELYTGENEKLLPIIVNEDSKGLIDSLYSTRKVKRKTMRVVISSLQ